jgi:hydroxyacyl-ACP dehydratase HTD2-like protein with hotdog domain
MATNTPNWPALRPPVTIPELVVVPDHVHIFMFSAVTWNRHHIHYSKDAATAEGHSDVVVQRALLGNYVARMITQWIGDSAELRALHWKVLRSASPNQPLKCCGELLEFRDTDLGRQAWCEVQIVATDDSPIVVGTASIQPTTP